MTVSTLDLVVIILLGVFMGAFLVWLSVRQFLRGAEHAIPHPSERSPGRRRCRADRCSLGSRTEKEK